jgi:hypothetical protein
MALVGVVVRGRKDRLAVPRNVEEVEVPGWADVNWAGSCRASHAHTGEGVMLFHPQGSGYRLLHIDGAPTCNALDCSCSEVCVPNLRWETLRCLE